MTLALLIIVLATGAAGTIYELVWFRMLTPVLGNSGWSLAAVLSAYMAGLSLGARWLGPLADRFERPWRSAAVLLFATAVLAFFVPSLLHLSSPLFVGLAARFEAGSLALHLVRFSLAFFLLLGPSLLFGAALSFVIRLLPPSRSYGSGVGLLYGLNTLGGVIGVVYAGFYAVETLRLGATATRATLLIVVSALLALACSFRKPASTTPAREPRDRTTEQSPAAIRLARLVLVVSGFTTLAYELIWARMLYFLLGNDGHSATYMLATLLFGLACGGFIHTRFLSRSRSPLSWLGAIQMALGCIVLITWQLAGALYVEKGVHVAWLFDDPQLTLSSSRVIYALLVVYLPGLLAGISFPLAAQIAGQGGGGRGAGLGRAAALNALGAAAGAAAPLVVLSSGVTTHTALTGFAALNFAVGAGALTLPSKRRWLPATAGTALLLVLVFAFPGDVISRMSGRDRAHAERLFYRESATAAISVYRDRIDGTKRLYVNQVSEVPTNAASIHCFKLLGHLPLLVHGDARQVLMITFGGGIASGAVVSHPIERLDVVDIESGVFEAAQHFAEENNEVLEDPRVHPHIEDGRNFLLNSRARFDVIISDSTHPRAVDSWVLYTQEFYRLCRERLAEGGVMAQWLPLHALKIETYASIVKTFQSVFPHASLWYTKDYSILLGTPSRLAIDPDRLAAALESDRIREDLAVAFFDDPVELIGSFVAGEDGLRNLSAEARVNTDDLPYTLFSELGVPTYPGVASAFLHHRESVERYLRPVPSGDTNRRALIERLQRGAAVQANLLRQDLAGAARADPASKRIQAYAKEAAARGDYLIAKLGYAPDDPLLRREVAELYMARGEFQLALKEIELVTASLPKVPGVWFLDGVAARRLGHGDRAERSLRRAVELDPEFFAAWGELGLIHYERGELEDARKMFEKVLALNPGDVGATTMIERVDQQR